MCWKNKYIFSICLLLLIGCVKSKQFTYDLPPPKPSPITSSKAHKISLGYTNLLVEPPARDQLNKIFQKDPVNKINEIILAELKSANLFSNIIMIPVEKTDDQQYLLQNDINIVMSIKLKEMQWEVPGYGGKKAAHTASYIAGGVLGSLIYGSTKTDVYGVTILDVSIFEPGSNKIYLDKKYEGRFKEITMKMKCDAPETKAVCIGKSLKEAMKQLRLDMIQVVAELERS